MLHTKFHRNRPTGSWKQIVLSIYTIYGHGSNRGHVTSIMLNNFHLLVFVLVKKKTYKIWLKMVQWFLRKASLNVYT